MDPQSLISLRTCALLRVQDVQGGTETWVCRFQHFLKPRIYHIKELMIRRELEKDPELKNENWERFLPHFKNRTVQRKKKIKKVGLLIVFFMFFFPLDELNNVQDHLSKRVGSSDTATCGGKEKEQRRVSTSAYPEKRGLVPLRLLIVKGASLISHICAGPADGDWRVLPQCSWLTVPQFPQFHLCSSSLQRNSWTLVMKNGCSEF